MPLRSLQERPAAVLRYGERAQRDALVQLDVAAYHGRLADYHAGAMVDEEARADFGAGMDIDAGLLVDDLVHHPGDQWHSAPEQEVRDPVHGNRAHGRIAEDDLFETCGCGIAVEYGLDIGSELPAQFGEFIQQFPGRLATELFGIGCRVGMEDDACPGTLAYEDLREFFEQSADRLRTEIAGEDHGPEEVDGLFQFRGINPCGCGCGDMGIGSGESVGDLPQREVGVFRCHWIRKGCRFCNCRSRRAG